MTSCDIDLRVAVDGSPVASATQLMRHGSRVLTIVTSIQDGDGPTVRLHSTYTGDLRFGTRSTHLLMSAAGSQTVSAGHHDDRGAPERAALLLPSRLAYDHAHRLLELLQQLGHEATADLLEHTLDALDRPAEP